MNYPTYEAQAEEDAAGAEPRYATLAELTSPERPVSSREEDFPLESGLTVKIRPLTRAEVLAVNKLQGLDTGQKEQKYLSMALVLPRMSEADVRKWQAASAAGDLEPLVERVQVISGLTKKGAKATAEEFPRSGE
jgi:hypothetical protein